MVDCSLRTQLSLLLQLAREACLASGLSDEVGRIDDARHADGPTIGSSGGAGGGACKATGAVDDGSALGRLGRASGRGGNSMS